MITTVAGGGFAMGDGGAAISAYVGTSQGVALDAAGNIYFLDTTSPRVRKVSSAGIIGTVAGNGAIGSSLFGSIGDGGPATSAGLNPSALPFFQGVAMDDTGNLYISDGGNHRVRKVDSSGTITTFAGNGSDGSGGDGGPATSAAMILPSGLALDSAGNLYIGDVAGARIRKVTNGIISTIVGTGTPGFSGDGGLAVNAQTYGPQGLAFDAQGNLYFSEFGSSPRVRKVDTNGIITTVAGNGSSGFSGDGGPAINAQFAASLAGVAADGAGNIYIADIANFRVRKVDSSGNVTTVAGIGLASTPGQGDGGSPTNAHVNPIGLALSASGNLYISDGADIREISFTAAPPGLAPSAFSLYFAASARQPQLQSQILTIDSAGPPLNFTASATTSSGANWLIAPPGTLTTPYPMTVSIVGGLAAGTYTGTLTFTPTTSSLAPVNVTITVAINPTLPADPVITAVVNGASFQPGYALGSFTTILGTNLASQTDNWNALLASGHLPTSLDGVVVTFNDYPAYITYISPTQTNVVAPWNQNAACCTVVVTNNGATSSFFSVQGSASGPAFFTWPGNQAVATRTDYSYAVKAGTFAGITTVAAKPGDVLILWGTGFGPTTPPALDGAPIPGNQLYSTSTLPTVTINNLPATVYGAALAPGYAGLCQVAIQVPATLADGDWPIQVGIDSAQSASGLILSVQH